MISIFNIEKSQVHTDGTVSVSGHMEVGTIRLGDMVRIGDNTINTIMTKVIGINVNGNLNIVTCEGENAELFFDTFENNFIETGMTVSTDLTSKKELADKYSRSIFDILSEKIHTLCNSNSTGCKMVTDITDIDVDIIDLQFSEIIDINRALAFISFINNDGLKDEYVLFTDIAVAVKVGSRLLKIAYDDIKNIQVSVDGTLYTFLASGNYKEIKTNYINTDSFKMLIEEISNISKKTQAESKKIVYKMSDREVVEGSKKKQDFWLHCIPALRTIQGSNIPGISGDYNRKRYEDKKRMEAYKDNAFGDRKTITCEYTGQVLHRDKEAAVHKYGNDKANVHIPNVEHIDSLSNTHKKYKGTVAGNLISDEQFKDILNGDDNFAMIGDKINKSKGSKSCGEYINKNDLSPKTRDNMIALQKRADATIKKKVRNAAVNNVSSAAAKDAGVAAAVAAPGIIYGQYKSVKNGEKSKNEAIKDGVIQIGQTAVIGAAISVAKTVAPAIGKALIKSITK